ncbi:MAG: glucoamylase family protein [Caldimonas sp.]
MALPALLRLVPDAPPELGEILDPSRGPLERPNRSEIFGPERFAQHGRSLGETHAAAYAKARAGAFFPRLRDNIRVLREAQRYIGRQATAGHEVSPAAEWLLDNFHLIEAQLREIREGLPRQYFRDLPVLLDEPLVGLPRVYGVAWAFVAHTDSAFDEDLLVHFLLAYEASRELTLGELWALPTTLRVVLIENLRRLAERAAASMAAREVANLCCDRIEASSPEQLDAVLALLNRRGVGNAFMVQMAQQLQDHRSPANARFFDWLQRVAPHLAEIQTGLPAAQAADNLSVSSAIRSLRSIGDADWPEIVASTSVLIRLMLTSPAFGAERDDTRSQTLHAIEILARKSARSEREVATTLLGLMHGPESSPALRNGDVEDDEHGEDDAQTVANHWLRGAGRGELCRALGVRDDGAGRRRALQRAALPAYLFALSASALCVVAWILVRHSQAFTAPGATPWLAALAALLLLFPASEAVVAIVNRLISESSRPVRMPRLAFASGITSEHRPMVAIPAMLTSSSSGPQLAHDLQLHYLANPERHAQFALLTDWADADSASTDTDAAVLDSAVAAIAHLNELYPTSEDMPARFIVLHRERRFAPSERRWIGWERKRGKLEQLIGLLAEGGKSPFFDLGRASTVAPGTRYVVTLDSDTRLPPGRLRDLVGVAAHPHNQPRLSADGRRVERGYGILQPHVATPLPDPEQVTLYHWLFAGQPGIDPYSTASSEVYQDVFGEGTFVGKGLIHVQAMHAVLSGRLPQGAVLSHDLLEGSVARCAAVTDVTVIEDAPFHADVAASRVHRWTRGDWQLLPFLIHAGRWRLRAINRWKMFDNLRRSLVAPMSLALLVFSLAGGFVSPWVALALVSFAFSGGPLMGALAGLAPSRDDIALTHFFRQAFADLGRAFASGAWLLAQLLQLALMAVDAIARALYRVVISRRGLLEWKTAAAAEKAATTELRGLLRKHWGAPLAAAVLLVALLAGGSKYPVLATILCVTWGLAPVWTWWVSRPRPRPRVDALSPADRSYMHDIARDTWRLFERCVGAEDRHLPPDNLQVTPDDIVAHRTSPTNIGLYLLSTACANRFGWIGGVETVERMEATLATLATLARHRGHFLNWYDTRTGEPLNPHYVSTVDSGNLCTHFLAVAQACLARCAAPLDTEAMRQSLRSSAARIAALRGATGASIGGSAAGGILAMRDPLSEIANDARRVEALVEAALVELAPSVLTGTDDLAPTSSQQLAWALGDHLATLRSALRDASPAGHVASLAMRLRAIAAQCRTLAEAPDFAFLFDRKRRLFHIGYRVAEHQLDSGFYDLLASEARATGLWAIAKGDVPAAHWAALGRPFYAVGELAGLRSWSGSMFEYLMPTLILEEPWGSVLNSAAQAAVHEHIAFARERDVPWGISESAYAASDHTLAYQYAPQGVPRLALRRTPTDELVIAPYATALAAQVAPHRAAANLRRLELVHARGRYGFIEAMDYSPSRQSGAEGVVRVGTFMAHHQGMTLVSLANLLLGGVPRKWGMGDARIEAVASLLHERAPREVPPLREPPASASPSLERRVPGMFREVTPGSDAIEPTHLLSNGRYAVALRANGAGQSRWGDVAVTRARDDALRDAFGWFFHLRWDRQPRPVSLTQHPAPDPAADYQCSFLADRVAFQASWSELETTTTVWVSPEDDIEFRRVVIHNTGERTLDIELMSSFEVVLADQRADESHPAFSNLFIGAEWQAAHQALAFVRKPRLATDRTVLAANFLAEVEPAGATVRIQVDRRHWLGRNRGPSHPLAAFDDPPASADGAPQTLDTGLDPVAAFSVRLQVSAKAQVQLTFCTAVADNATTLRAVIDKYRQLGNIERASLMSATLTGIRLREMRINAENFAAIQTLSTALSLSLTRTHVKKSESHDVCDRRLLWRFGISGDRPIVLVSAGISHGLGLLRSLAQALRLWSWGGVACDLIVVNFEPASYLMELHRAIAALKEAHVAAMGAQPGCADTGFHLLQSSDLHGDEISTLRAVARVRLSADGRPLAHHVQELAELHERAMQERQAISGANLSDEMGAEIVPRHSTGEFAAAGGEFRFDVTALQRPARPWVNVLANPGFGTQVSEAGGGYSWGENSRLNQLTPWSNDAVADGCGEWLLLQDMRTHQAWSMTPSAAGDAEAHYRVAHGQGYTVIGHRHGALETSVTWCVDNETAVKQVRVRLTNRGHRTLQLRLIGIAEWILGAQRSDRASTFTSMAVVDAAHGSDDASAAGAAEAQQGGRATVLFCTQRDRSAGFGGGTAFFALGGDAAELADWTCDRREMFDSRGRVVVPDHWGQASGGALDPCAALSTQITLRAGEALDRVFLLGYAGSPDAAHALAERAAKVPPLRRLHQVRARWDELLGTAIVRTPDPLFDAMVNRWLLYQTISCRLWARAGFYQAGGAYGYRDQLQDSLALAGPAPALLRAQIVLAASRQFVAGDVQHWWHAPTGAGVRTHFSDDLLWLPYACAHYLTATGDTSVLDERVPFLEGAEIPAGAEDAYYVPATSEETASLFEHCARTIDRSLPVGTHGLPLMGTGDWNDGMNRVGHHGKGESVWLAWFLCDVVERFAPVAEHRGEQERASRWREAGRGWRAALETAGWDGAWYRRAFFDDGSPLGSASNVECRIDLIAQSWAVLSGAAPEAHARMAMASLERDLVDKDAGLIRLLDPPLAEAEPSAGYIQAYPKGVRENGGQYSHAGVWALMAQARLGDGDAAYRYFTCLSPAHRSRHPMHGPRYEIEPYVMAGDVYTAPPYVGRGGWSWYTGSAAWMQRAAIESMFGLAQRGDAFELNPCLPTSWAQAELRLTKDGKSARILFSRIGQTPPEQHAAAADARLLRPGETLHWSSLDETSTWLIVIGSIGALPAQADATDPAAHASGP